MTDINSLRAEFLNELIESGTVSDPEWLAAFRDIPRAAFVPYYFTQRPNQPGWLLVERPSREWLEGVYSTRALITQIDGTDDNAARARTGRVNGTATSSSSAPSLMALILEAADIHDGHWVLEVGTGTGYNAALLCHRLGADNVTSIDIDADLVNRTRERLATVDDHDADTRETGLPIDQVTNAAVFEFFAALVTGGFDALGFTPTDGGPPETWLTQRDGTWACHTTYPDGTQIVRQGDPGRLWDDIETAHRRWQQLGQPARTRFGLTATPQAQWIWLDTPDNVLTSPAALSSEPGRH